jgi:hypothetical protein
VPEKVAVTDVWPLAFVEVLVLERLAAPAGVTVQLTDWPATGNPDPAAVSTSTWSGYARTWLGAPVWLLPCVILINPGCAGVTDSLNW